MTTIYQQAYRQSDQIMTTKWQRLADISPRLRQWRRPLTEQQSRRLPMQKSKSFGFVLATCLILVMMISVISVSLITMVTTQVQFNQASSYLASNQATMSRYYLQAVINNMVRAKHNLSLDKPGYIGRWQPIQATKINWQQQAVAFSPNKPHRYLLLYLGEKPATSNSPQGMAVYLFKAFTYHQSPSGKIEINTLFLTAKEKGNETPAR